MTLIVTPRNRKEEKILKAFLSLRIGFHSDAEEDAALHNAMQKGRKTALLGKAEKAAFLKSLKQAR